MKIADTSFNNVNNLGVKSCKSDPAVFTWYFDKKKKKKLAVYYARMQMIFLFGGNEFFMNNVIETLESIFTVGS